LDKTLHLYLLLSLHKQRKGKAAGRTTYPGKKGKI
jgi:hypothetical protein